MITTFVGCGDDSEIIILTIASKRFPINTTESYGFIVKYENAKEWTKFWSIIEGFEYEEGFEYVISVTSTKIKPVVDGSSRRYQLNEVISSIEKESEDIPPILFN